MKILIIALSLVMASSTCFAKDVHVRGHYRSDGTYVQPHHRSNPNNTGYDNWSTKGNTNPYTGEKGTKEAYY